MYRTTTFYSCKCCFNCIFLQFSSLPDVASVWLFLYKGQRNCPIWLGIYHRTNHNSVSFHFFTPPAPPQTPTPPPGKKKHTHTVQGRRGKEVQAILENIMSLCWCQENRFPFSQLPPFAFKRPQCFSFFADPTRLVFPVGFSGEAFFLSEVVETACRVTRSLYANTIQLMCETK